MKCMPDSSTVPIADVESDASRDDIERRTLTDALGITEMAINHYVIEPGERISGLHAHMDQEELFFILSGALVFETLSGAVTVSEDEAIRFAPGEFQSGKNVTDESVAVLGCGAPRDSEEIRIPLACPDCDHDVMRPDVIDGDPVLVCPNCGAKSDARCPNCGNDSMQAVISEKREGSVGVCKNCGVTSEV